MELPFADAKSPPSELPVSTPLTEPPVKLLEPCANVLALISTVNVCTDADALISVMRPPKIARLVLVVSVAVSVKFDKKPVPASVLL